MPKNLTASVTAAGVQLDYVRSEDGSELVRAALRVEFLRVGEGT